MLLEGGGRVGCWADRAGNNMGEILFAFSISSSNILVGNTSPMSLEEVMSSGRQEWSSWPLASLGPIERCKRGQNGAPQRLSFWGQTWKMGT